MSSRFDDGAGWRLAGYPRLEPGVKLRAETLPVRYRSHQVVCLVVMKVWPEASTL